MARFILALAVAVIALHSYAYAQDTTIPVAPIWRLAEPYIMALLVPLGGAVVGILVDLARKKLNLDIEARHREALQTALTNGAGLVVARVGASIVDSRIDVKHPAIAAAVGYVLDAAPDAIKRFGLSAEQLSEKIAAKVPQVVASTKA